MGFKFSLKKWYLVPDLTTKSVRVAGLLIGRGGDYRAGRVKDRAAPDTVVTWRNATVTLLGPIERSKMVKLGWSSTLIEQFAEGFPVDWQECVEREHGLLAEDIFKPKYSREDFETLASQFQHIDMPQFVAKPGRLLCDSFRLENPEAKESEFRKIMGELRACDLKQKAEAEEAAEILDELLIKAEAEEATVPSSSIKTPAKKRRKSTNVKKSKIVKPIAETDLETAVVPESTSCDNMKLPAETPVLKPSETLETQRPRKVKKAKNVNGTVHSDSANVPETANLDEQLPVETSILPPLNPSETPAVERPKKVKKPKSAKTGVESGAVSETAETETEEQLPVTTPLRIPSETTEVERPKKVRKSKIAKINAESASVPENSIPNEQLPVETPMLIPSETPDASRPKNARKSKSVKRSVDSIAVPESTSCDMKFQVENPMLNPSETPETKRPRRSQRVHEPIDEPSSTRVITLRSWTIEEYAAIYSGVKRHGLSGWEAIKRENPVLSNREFNQIKYAHKKIHRDETLRSAVIEFEKSFQNSRTEAESETPGRVSLVSTEHRWTKEEYLAILEGVAKFGKGNWVQIRDGIEILNNLPLKSIHNAYYRLEKRPEFAKRVLSDSLIEVGQTATDPVKGEMLQACENSVSSSSTTSAPNQRKSARRETLTRDTNVQKMC